MKQRYNRKNLTILILWATTILFFVTTVIFFATSLSQSSQAEYTTEQLDARYKTSYLSLLDSVERGDFAANKDAFTVIDAENAKHGYLMNTLLPFTSFGKSETLKDITRTLNDYLGENRMHTDLVFPELSQDLYTQMRQLAEDFHDEAKAKQVKDSLYSALGLTQ